MVDLVSALSDSVDFAPPQPILGLLFGHVHQENLSKYRTAILPKWYESRRAPALNAGTREFYTEWRAYIQLAPDDGCFNFWARIIDERAERQDADGCLHHEFNSKRAATQASRPCDDW